MFEKRAMFEPIVPVPTLRIFEAKMFFVVRAFDAKMLPVTPTVGPAAVSANPPAEKRVPKTLVVDRAFDAKMFPVTPTVGPPATIVNPPADKKLALTFVEVIVGATKLKIFEVPATFAVVE